MYLFGRLYIISTHILSHRNRFDHGLCKQNGRNLRANGHNYFSFFFGRSMLFILIITMGFIDRSWHVGTFTSFVFTFNDEMFSIQRGLAASINVNVCQFYWLSIFFFRIARKLLSPHIHTHIPHFRPPRIWFFICQSIFIAISGLYTFAVYFVVVRLCFHDFFSSLESKHNESN